MYTCRVGVRALSSEVFLAIDAWFIIIIIIIIKMNQ